MYSQQLHHLSNPSHRIQPQHLSSNQIPIITPYTAPRSEYISIHSLPQFPYSRAPKLLTGPCTMKHAVERPYRPCLPHHPQTRHYQRMFSYIIPSIRYRRRPYIMSHFTDQNVGKHRQPLQGVCQECYAVGSWSRVEYMRPMKTF